MPVATDRPGERPVDLGTEGSSPRTSRRAMLAWSLVSSGLLLGSGALRVARSGTGRPGDLNVKSPFSLKTIPRSIDGWKFAEGSETLLDPLTTRITGSTDHLIRTYYDEMTGTALSVLILYGPAEPVLPHTPQVCYPASGYRSLADPTDQTIKIDDHLSTVFRASLFAKPGGRSVIRQSVYHAYRLDGVWSPTVSNLSLPRRQAGLFKVQIQRRVLDGERTEGDEPIESFLRQLVPTMEQMIAQAAPPTQP